VKACLHRQDLPGKWQRRIDDGGFGERLLISSCQVGGRYRVGLGVGVFDARAYPVNCRRHPRKINRIFG
ncbi:MAG TPA: hypothetical protein VFE86_12735, partial [Ilumatobacteraceae bacterium]|nr:hypothetical protein [Ilumatobacteraceae bacterium]